MEKYSEYAKKKLDKLGIPYLMFLVLIFVFSVALGRNLKELTINIVLGLLAIIFFGFIVWFTIRKEIKEENEIDTLKKLQIEDYYMHITSIGVENKERWLEKKILSARFASDEEKMGTEENSFYYNILLSGKGCGYGISKEMKMDYFFRPGSGKIMKIDGIDRLALLPYSTEARTLLTRIFDFIDDKYKYKKNLTKKTNHTLKALRDTRKNIIEYVRNVLSVNYQDALEIFLSGEEFEVAGIELDGGNNTKIFLLTAIREGDKEIVLFPTKTIVDIFDNLNSIVLKN
ncbi:MAG: hypothetical protein L6275_02380 [Candidatus Portnoybacteria bacterium]|nr:hypothetical protein [Candidatus Portnoybacteria bacterium]